MPPSSSWLRWSLPPMVDSPADVTTMHWPLRFAPRVCMECGARVEVQAAMPVIEHEERRGDRVEVVVGWRCAQSCAALAQTA